MPDNASAGAMPVVRSATLLQSYPSGPEFAAYRLPFPGSPGAREAGVCFEGAPAGGANPQAGTPPTTPPAGTPPATPPTPPATGDPAELGDAGKRAIEAERAAAKAATKRADDAEKALADLKLAGASEADKAIAAARKEGADEATEKANAKVRRSEVRAALATAGINASVLDLATKADEFAALKVTDDGDVEGLAEAIKAFKAAKPDLFKAPVAAGSAGGGTPAGGTEPAKTLTSALERHYAPQG